MRIVGAGLSGLIAAHAWPNAPVIEASSALRQEHKALLRFRSNVVSTLTGIEFKQVQVRKGLWSNGAFCAPTIALANAYSKKVIGQINGDRSIWNLEPVTRWIAPEDFHARLIGHVGSRLQVGVVDDFRNGPLISTAPMSMAIDALQQIDPQLHALELKRSSIEVKRYRVPKCDVYQTVYFPDATMGLYRASITGDVLIVERAAANMTEPMSHRETSAIEQAFDIDLFDCHFVDQTRQHFGKIVDLPTEVRKSVLFRLTHNHQIYSLGRFATWRNILLDDVVQDISVIKRLLSTADTKFDLARARAS